MSNNCCIECICEYPHQGKPSTNEIEINLYAFDPKYITEDPIFCCDLCTCEIPHRSKPLD